MTLGIALREFFESVPLGQALSTREIGNQFGCSDQSVGKLSREWARKRGLQKVITGKRGNFRFLALGSPVPGTVEEPGPSISDQLMEIFAGAPTGRLFDTHELRSRLNCSSGMVSYAGVRYAAKHGLIKQRVGASGFLFVLEPALEPALEPQEPQEPVQGVLATGTAVLETTSVAATPLIDDEWDAWRVSEPDSVLGRLARIELKIDLLLREWGVES